MKYVRGSGPAHTETRHGHRGFAAGGAQLVPGHVHPGRVADLRDFTGHVRDDSRKAPLLREHGPEDLRAVPAFFFYESYLGDLRLLRPGQPRGRGASRVLSCRTYC